MKISLEAYAKINIFLDILGRLENGYHSLFMVMQSVDLADTVTLEEKEEGISLECSEEGIPTDGRNTAYRAAEYFFEETGISKGVKITITKRIPHEAGLAGGSADAAAVIEGLSRLYRPDLPGWKKREIGLRVGSDVPFCLVGGTCLAQNTGGVLSPLKPISGCSIVLAKPEKGVSTAKAYADADSTHIYHPDCIRMLAACEKGDFDAICRYAGNVFEQVVEVPERVEIKHIMRKYGASLAQMSGSGPTVFGIFRDEKSAEKAAEEIGKICGKVFLTKPVSAGTAEE